MHTIAIIVGAILITAVGIESEAWGAECRFRGDPIVPGLGSLLLPGLGQFLNGEDGKGLVHLVVAIALPTVTLLAGDLLWPASPTMARILRRITPLLYLGWAVQSAVDAYQVAGRRCRGGPGI